MSRHNITDEMLKNYLTMCYISNEYPNMETFKRYEREAKRRFPEWVEFMKSTQKIREKFSKEEISELSRGERIVPKREKRISFRGDVIRFAHITDTHFGASAFHEDIWDAVVDEINGLDLDFVFHSGDVVEGLSARRMDAVYDLTHIGYAQQKDYAVELLSKVDKDIYAISGNHDRFFLKSAGALVVSDISKELDNFHYLGEDMADFIIEGDGIDIKVRLFHGEDGNSYSTSYRLQKLVESFSGGDKPHVLLAGHTHKQVYIFERNIHCLSGGAVCTQSNWMRSKRLANHTGFHIVEMEINERGITRFSPTWYPFYR